MGWRPQKWFWVHSTWNFKTETEGYLPGLVDPNLFFLNISRLQAHPPLASAACSICYVCLIQTPKKANEDNVQGMTQKVNKDNVQDMDPKILKSNNKNIKNYTLDAKGS